MSVLAMPTDIQDRDLAGRKRSHGDFLQQETCGSEHSRVDLSLSDKENDVPHTSHGPSTVSPAKSSTLDCKSPTPNQPAAPTSTQQTSAAKSTPQKMAGEPPKKKRLTGEEKAARDAAVEAEKRKKQEEREQKRREKEEAEKLKAEQKAEQKAAKAADKAEKDQEKKQRTEEREKKKREKEEEEAKKARSQMKLTSMFNRNPVTPKKEPAAPKPTSACRAGAANGEEKEPSLYEQMFKPFFVKEHVRLAANPAQVDGETREAKTKILDEYMSGARKAPSPTFDPIETLQIPYKVRRGRVYPSVKKIMAEFEDRSSGNPSDPTTESQNAQIRHTLEALKSVPMKSIKFREDVRPPYFGTISGLPPGGQSLQKLARNPVSRNVLALNYDYDSEAEWQEEEGEDVDDLDDEEEEGDVEDDMGDFLDDSEDAGLGRMVFSGGMEPESTGPCWEDRTRKVTEPRLYKFRLEFILQPLEHHHSIDPFSTAYWETPKPRAAAGNVAPTTSTTTSKSAQDPRTNPISDAFQALNGGPSSSSSTTNTTTTITTSTTTTTTNTTSGAAAGMGTGTKKSQQPLAADLQQALKDLVRAMPTLSKVGVIELFAANHPGVARGQIKTAFDALFEKSGKVFKVRGE